ncbi:MAG: YitT family protein [Paenibacillaceae bacterium]
MLTINARSLFRSHLPIMLGTAIYAFGLHYFIIPNQLMEGGITGIALILNYALSLPPSITTLVLNIPLFILGWYVFGKSSMASTIFGTVSLSFFLWVMEFAIKHNWLNPFYTHNDYLLVALYAGVTLGAGLGIVFRYGGTTGGSDIIARIVQKKRGWSMGQFILVMDVVVIFTSLLYIPKEKVLYTLVTVFIVSRIIDFIQDGAYAAKAFTIITDHSEAVAASITKEMDRGVTLFAAKGAYSQQSKQVVYCVVYRHEMRRMKALIREMDDRAFLIISDVHDVLGEGFKMD